MKLPTTGGRTILTAALVLGLAACGDTYLETSATTLPPEVTVTTLAPVDPDAPLDELLTEIETLMFDLDERITDGHDPAGTMARIDELWVAAEPKVREAELDSVYQFEQAIDLARNGVTRKRPADASKAYKTMMKVVDAFAG
jgi:hypothetical protein